MLSSNLKSNWGKMAGARLNAQQALYNMGVISDFSDKYALLFKLLGIADRDEMTMEHAYACDLIAGPHGYTIYKLLLIHSTGEETKQDHQPALISDGNGVL